MAFIKTKFGIMTATTKENYKIFTFVQQVLLKGQNNGTTEQKAKLQ